MWGEPEHRNTPNLTGLERVWGLGFRVLNSHNHAGGDIQAPCSEAGSEQETPMTALLGTIYYIAPEVIRGQISVGGVQGFGPRVLGSSEVHGARCV